MIIRLKFKAEHLAAVLTQAKQIDDKMFFDRCICTGRTECGKIRLCGFGLRLLYHRLYIFQAFLIFLCKEAVKIKDGFQTFAANKKPCLMTELKLVTRTRIELVLPP